MVISAMSMKSVLSYVFNYEYFVRLISNLSSNYFIQSYFNQLCLELLSLKSPYGKNSSD